METFLFFILFTLVIVKWAQIYRTLRVEAVERGKAKVGVGDMDEVHCR